MWPDFVVILSPCINDLPGFLQRPEPVLIQTAVPELAIEAFHKGILGRLAMLDELQPDLIVPAPEEYGLGGKFCAIVTSDASGPASLCYQLFQEPGDPVAADRQICQLANALPGEVIHHVQHPEPSASSQLVMDKVH